MAKDEENEEYEIDYDIPTPPDGGWGWMIMLASLVINFIVDGIGYAFGVLLPIFAEHFGESKGKASLVGSLLFGIYLCSGPIASGLVNKFGCRAVTIAGSILASAGFLLGSFSSNMNVLILTYGGLGGLGFGLIYLPSIVSVGFYFEKRRALATGIAMCGSGIGTFVFSPLNDFLLEKYGWQNLLFIQSGIILNGIVCGMLMRPLQSEPQKKQEKKKQTRKSQELVITKRTRADSEPVGEEVLTKLLDNHITDLKNDTNGSTPEITFIHKTQSDKGIKEAIIIKEITPGARTRSTQLSVPARSMISRPMYRKDIFYSGSIDHIPQYRSSPDIKTYITSITSIPGVTEVAKPSVWDKCTCLPKTVTDIMREMLDFSLLLNISFFMLFLGNIFVCTGYFIPFSYIVDRAVQLNIPSSKAAFLISIMGITNTVGRVLCGFLADLSFVDPLKLNNAILLVSGFALLLEPLCTTYTTLVIFSLVYGLCIAAYISLTSPIICDLLGIGKLSNAFGLLVLARGMSGSFGPPLAGAVYRSTQTYDTSFYLGGGMYLAGALCHMVLHLPCIKRFDYDKEKKENELP